LRYGLSLAAVLLVVALRVTADSFLHLESDFFLFPLTVFLVAWRLGLGPGLLATAVSTVAAWTLFFDPQLTLGQRLAHTLVFMAQAAVTSFVAWYLERLHSARLRADRRSASLLDNIDDGFFTLDADWRFTFFNRYLARYACGGVEDLTGKDLWQTYPEFLGSVYEEPYRRAMKERLPSLFEAKSLLRDRWFRIHVYPYEDGIAVFTTDITDRRKAEEEMRKAKEEAERRSLQAQEARLQAEAASRMKDQFLATLSHELRTPLNSILGWAQILRSGDLEAEGVRRGLETIERSSRVQAQLIDDLLDVSRIISGKMRLELRSVDLPEIIDAALAAVAPAAQAKGVRIDKNYALLPGLVSGDPERLQQVVWNLLSNSVKFNQRGGRVEVRLQLAEDGQHAEIQVADTGQGIEPDFLPFVFDPFRQADASTTRRQGGLGLGLSIVRHMVEGHGGSVRVESAGDGRGAAFTVALPLVPYSALLPEQGRLSQPLAAAEIAAAAPQPAEPPSPL
jgi:signal transduction histidine kinase